MARRVVAAVVCLLLVLPVTAVSAQEAARQDDAELDVYTAEVDPGDDVQLRKDGIDVVGVERGRPDAGPARKRGRRAPPTVTVEMVLSADEVAELEERGVDVELKTNADGQSVAEAAALRAEEGFDVWRPYSGAGGLQEEIEQLAAQYPKITKLVTIGESLQGKPIYALKVTTNPRRPDGTKPAVLYSSTQHAREWITPEVNRRLLRHYLEHYGSDRRITDLLERNELWFVLVMNPDGYDYTFSDERLWRKNLRDNDGDGQTTTADGVDLNRNYPYKWGYDNEGSSPDITNQTYRGTAPASEPETRAIDDFSARIGFEFVINYHSAAELLLYGVGWQVATPTPDDRVFEALAGTDANPAVPGYDPDIAAELYTTNGETTEHLHATYDSLGFTPELDTCKSATLFFDDDEWEPSDCDEQGLSVFEFPDDERLVQRAFEKNLPFALSVAASAADPDDPASVVGIDTEPMYVDRFAVSTGSPQTVAVEAKRALRALRLRYRINGGRAARAKVREWQGGERYGDEGDTWYAEYRGTVTGASPGDRVEVWFEATEPGRGRVSSEHFTYDVRSDSRAEVLVIANEDYTGVNPEQAGGPAALAAYTGALEANGVAHDTWDVDADGVPHDLGVLSHYDTVIWETGANRITQDPEDEEILIDDEGVGPPTEFPDIGVAERQQYLMLSVRDHLNDGGKLLHAGENAGYFGILGIGGLYYGLNGAPEEECVVEQSIDQNPVDAIFEDCLIYADDFYQYYLGAYARTALTGPAGFEGTGVLEGVSGLFGGPGLQANPLDEAGNFTVTSDVLPPEEFPQFASAQAATYGGETGPGPFEPFEGEAYVGAVHADNSFMRLQRSVAVPDTGGQLSFALSYNTEPAYDHVIVEVTDADGNRTTLPEAGGATSTAASAACDQYASLHPSLLVYDGIGSCATGTTGTWNSFTGNGGGWEEVAFDLGAYAGQTVTISISYVTDGGVGTVGAFVDNVQVPGEDEIEGFESGLGAWTVPGPPAGSPPNAGDWQQGGALFVPSAGVSTEDSVLFGFGLEHVEDPAVRAATLAEVLDHLR